MNKDHISKDECHFALLVSNNFWVFVSMWKNGKQYNLAKNCKSLQRYSKHYEKSWSKKKKKSHARLHRAEKTGRAKNYGDMFSSEHLQADVNTKYKTEDHKLATCFIVFNLIFSLLLCMAPESVIADFSVCGRWSTAAHCPEGLEQLSSHLSHTTCKFRVQRLICKENTLCRFCILCRVSEILKICKPLIFTYACLS